MSVARQLGVLYAKATMHCRNSIVQEMLPLLRSTVPTLDAVACSSDSIIASQCSLDLNASCDVHRLSFKERIECDLVSRQLLENGVFTSFIAVRT
jgi:hypothetical protein